MFCRTCRAADPETDTVKFDPAAIATEEAAQSEWARQEQQRREQEELDAARRAEDLQRRADERAEEERRKEAEERALHEAEEEERLARERDAARTQELAAEEQRALEKVRRATVANYLRSKGFKGGAAEPKKGLLSSTYPLHEAAKEGNARMVQMLLKEGAPASQKDSSGRTAVQLAERSNKGGSHAAVLSALAAGGSVGAPRAGGC